jgi:Domain of unknown function (DUF4440)
MTRIRHFGLTAAAALVFTAGANAAKTAENTVAAAPTKVALVSLEKSAYEAWKSKDSKFWDSFLADNFVGWGSSGRLDKASATKEYSGAGCEIKGYALSDEQMTPLGQNATLITHKTTVNGICRGQQIPPASWAAGVYVRDGNRSKAAFHVEAPIVDPAALAVRPVGEDATRQEHQTKPIAPDAHTDVLLALEKAIWEAWKDHDAKKMDGLTAGNMQFINIFGIHLATKAEALKNWSGEGCDVKTVGLTDAAATMLSPTVGILTFHASADGTCFGQKVGPVWGSSVYVKHGNAWKWTFGINVPALREGV